MGATTIAILVGLGTLLGGGGVVALVRIAVSSSDKRADDWREIARTSQAAASLLSGHVEKLVSAVEQLTAAQRESLALLRGMAAERRETA